MDTNNPMPNSWTAATWPSYPVLELPVNDVVLGPGDEHWKGEAWLRYYDNPDKLSDLRQLRTKYPDLSLLCDRCLILGEITAQNETGCWLGKANEYLTYPGCNLHGLKCYWMGLPADHELVKAALAERSMDNKERRHLHQTNPCDLCVEVYEVSTCDVWRRPGKTCSRCEAADLLCTRDGQMMCSEGEFNSRALDGRNKDGFKNFDVGLDWYQLELARRALYRQEMAMHQGPIEPGTFFLGLQKRGQRTRAPAENYLLQLPGDHYRFRAQPETRSETRSASGTATGMLRAGQQGAAMCEACTSSGQAICDVDLAKDIGCTHCRKKDGICSVQAPGSSSDANRRLIPARPDGMTPPLCCDNCAADGKIGVDACSWRQIVFGLMPEGRCEQCVKKKDICRYGERDIMQKLPDATNTVLLYRNHMVLSSRLNPDAVSAHMELTRNFRFGGGVVYGPPYTLAASHDGPVPIIDMRLPPRQWLLPRQQFPVTGVDSVLRAPPTLGPLTRWEDADAKAQAVAAAEAAAQAAAQAVSLSASGQGQGAAGAEDVPAWLRQVQQRWVEDAEDEADEAAGALQKRREEQEDEEEEAARAAGRPALPAAMAAASTKPGPADEPTGTQRKRKYKCHICPAPSCGKVVDRHARLVEHMRRHHPDLAAAADPGAPSASK